MSLLQRVRERSDFHRLELEHQYSAAILTPYVDSIPDDVADELLAILAGLNANLSDLQDDIEKVELHRKLLALAAQENDEADQCDVHARKLRKAKKPAGVNSDLIPLHDVEAEEIARVEARAAQLRGLAEDSTRRAGQLRDHYQRIFCSWKPEKTKSKPQPLAA